MASAAAEFGVKPGQLELPGGRRRASPATTSAAGAGVEVVLAREPRRIHLAPRRCATTRNAELRCRAQADEAPLRRTASRLRSRRAVRPLRRASSSREVIVAVEDQVVEFARSATELRPRATSDFELADQAARHVGEPARLARDASPANRLRSASSRSVTSSRISAAASGRR